MDKHVEITYSEYASMEELAVEDRNLLEQAIKACDSSYAPYSHFNVGAAVLLENGEILSASNQENSAYPSGLCAERSTVFYTHSKYPEIPIKALAVAAKHNGVLTENPTYPCGACRQVLYESQVRGKKKIRVIIGSATKIQVINSIDDLLPFAFDNLPE